MFETFALTAESELGFWEKIAEWYQGSLLHELLSYLYEEYFTVNFGVYENFTIGTTTAETIRTLIPALAIALVIASMMTAHMRVNIGRFVRRLLKNECLSPEKAKTLAELNFFRNAALRRELSRGTGLRMVVRCVHEDGTDTGVGSYLDQTLSPDSTAEMSENASTVCENEDLKGEKRAKKGSRAQRKINFLTARFYIPEDLKYRADVRFDNRGSGWAPAIASIALVIFLTALLCWLLPHVLWLADAIISLAAPG